MKKSFTLFITLLLTSASFFAQGNLINVPDDYASIQSAINASVDGDTVLVELGTYYENINFKGKKIVLTSRFYLDKEYWVIQNTIIDGGNPEFPDSASVVKFISGEDENSILQGFTLTHGTGTKWPDSHIGGFYREGGGILMQGASPVIKNNIITENEAINFDGVTSAGGGAIRCDNGQPQIIGNVISHNKGMYGAGIVVNYSGAIIKNNLIFSNTGGEHFGGGGIWMYENSTFPKIIENNTILNNSVSGTGTYSGKGGGIFIWATTAVLKNNIVWGNQQYKSKQITALDGGVADCSYSIVQDGQSGTGNINTEPVFSTNFSLADGSPGVDAGSPDVIYNDLEDPQNPGQASFPSLGTTLNDMGAFGGPGRITVFGEMTSVANDEENENIPQQFGLDQNYPNPFNPSTKISYQLPVEGHVKLEVVNSIGEVVNILVDENKPGGVHEINFNASKLGSGVYFYRLISGKYSSVRKMILMK